MSEVPMNEKWIEWARDQREQYKKWLALAESGRFKTSEIEGSGIWKDNTHEYIARLTEAIASLDDLIGDTLRRVTSD
jgi:hypothetical protein